jgi:hypothetical protein
VAESYSETLTTNPQRCTPDTSGTIKTIWFCSFQLNTDLIIGLLLKVCFKDFFFIIFFMSFAFMCGQKKLQRKLHSVIRYQEETTVWILVIHGLFVFHFEHARMTSEKGRVLGSKRIETVTNAIG